MKFTHCLDVAILSALVAGATAPGRVAAGDEEPPRLVVREGHSIWVESVAFSPDGKRLLTGSFDNTARLWDAETGQQVRTLGHSAYVTSVAFSPDGKRVLTGSGDRTARLWNAQTGEEIRAFLGHAKLVDAVAFSPDGKRVLTGSGDATARLWDAETGQVIRAFRLPAIPNLLGPIDNWVHSVAFSPDGKRMLTGSNDGTARLWDVETGWELRVIQAHADIVQCAAFSADGKRIVTASVGSQWRNIARADQDRTARVWDVATGRLVCTVWGVTAAAISPDGKRLLAAWSDNTARLWDIATVKETTALQGHSYHVTSAAFSPDGRRVLTGGMDGTARLWDPDTGRELCCLVSFEKGWAVFDPAGRYDAPNPDESPGLHWVAGDTSFPLGRLRKEYYDPALLAKSMGLNKQSLKPLPKKR